jgi:hypothetical protein
VFTTEIEKQLDTVKETPNLFLVEKQKTSNFSRKKVE